MRKISYFEKVYKSFMKQYSQFYHNILTNLREKIKELLLIQANSPNSGVLDIMRITEKTIDRRIYTFIISQCIDKGMLT